jgi:hypothetical protein
MLKAPIFRKCKYSQTGRNAGDVDVAFQLFSCGMVWDGNLSSKDGKMHLVRNGFAVCHDGMTALTGKGIMACLASFHFWRSAFRRWRLWKRNPLIADEARIKRSMA